MNARNRARDSFLQNTGVPSARAPCSWNTAFARSTPITATSSMDADAVANVVEIWGWRNLRLLNQPRDEDASSAAIVDAIVKMSASMGIDTTAEGIETEAQLAAVIRHGCSEVQGYLVSRPLPASDARAFIARTIASQS